LTANKKIKKLKTEVFLKNNSSHILFRRPEISDAYSIWTLIKESPPLDLNSLYCYLIICTHFADTSIVAEDPDGVCGFISAYIHPDNDNTLFVWQVVVKKEKIRQGIADGMLQSLLRRKHKKAIQYLETTVNPSNAASGALFYSTAKSLNTKCNESVLFTEKDFGNQAHEDEILYRIGPFDIT
jgi:L-2,4-diaminobutyric acid acetyltransferase